MKSSDGQQKEPAPDLVHVFIRFAVALLCLGQAALLPGCGGPKTTTTVGGTIALDGLPLDNGAISFYPVDGGVVTAAQSAGATIGKDGRYQAEVAPGRFRVEITSSRVVGQRKTYEDIPDSPMEEILEERIPRQYNTASELVRDIDLGTSTVDFQLTSPKNAPRQP